MPAIQLAGFRGEQPRIIPRLLPESGAQVAVNTRLDDGGLTPFREALNLAVSAGGVNYKTIYRFGATWLSWADVVHAAPGPVDDTRLYYTGDGVPKMRQGVDIYDLAIAAPAAALTATLGGVGAGDVVDRIYVYTWVTDFGEESEPNPASNSIAWKPGNTVTVSGFVNAPAGRNITKQRIYRSQTGQSGTYFYLINERAATNGNYSDTVAPDAFAEPLPSADWNPPPSDLLGLVPMANGMMAAYSGRLICFCEPYRPHAWPEKYQLTADYDIVGLAAIGTTLFVLTSGKPYIFRGALPEAMQPDTLEADLPCVNGRGIANLGFAVAWPSNLGLAIAYADGRAGLASEALFSKEDWLALDPTTIIGGVHAGRYAGFYDTLVDGAVVAGAIFIDVKGEIPYLIRTSDRVTATFYDLEESALCFLPKDDDDIFKFDDAGSARRSQYWRSKPFVLPYPENFGAIQVDADETLDEADIAAAEAAAAAVIAANVALLAIGSVSGEIDAGEINGFALNGDAMAPIPSTAGHVQVGVFADGVLVKTVLRTNRPARLPSGFKARTWEIDVAGDVTVTHIVVGKTMDDIRATP